MAQYLRDERITNITLDIHSIESISMMFLERLHVLNNGIPENDSSESKGMLTYIIRFDNKGYRVFSIEELKYYYDQAKEVERIIFSIETMASLKSNRSIGAYMELRTDKNDAGNSFITISSDDKDWVDASFSATQEVLSKYKNINKYFRTSWTPFIVQILGIVVGFTLSLWFAFRLAAFVKVENPFVIVFLFAFLVFSNIWTYLNAQILRFLNYYFPNIRFVREERERIHWLVRTIIGSSVFATILFLLKLLLDFLTIFMKNLFGNGA